MSSKKSTTGRDIVTDERPRSRAELIEALGHEVRLQQNATEAIDELFSLYIGVNRTDARCMDLLDVNGPMTAGELADRAGVTTGSVTAILDRMERAGYVRRVRDAADRRKIHVELTEEARRVSNEFYAPIVERGAQLLMRFSADELRTILEAARVSRELSESFAAELRQRVPRRGLLDAVRSLKEEARAIKTEWTEEGRAIKRDFAQQPKAGRREAKDPRRRTIGR
jgi:DNA-binding MarR family transcriptional regulator